MRIIILSDLGSDTVTTFRFPCYRDLLRSLGNFDAICGYTTIAIDFLNEELGQNNEPRDWLARYSQGHGVILHDVDSASLSPRLAEMFVLLVHAHFEEFLRSLIDAYTPSQEWGPRGDASLFDHVIKNLKLAHSSNAAEVRETIEYYRLVRNAIAHPGDRASKLRNQRNKVRNLLSITSEYQPPRELAKLSYSDFLMFTRAVKAYAAVICQAARPSDAEIADLILPAIRRLNRFPKKSQRFRNAVRQFLLMNYGLDSGEADGIINCLPGR